LTEGRGREKKKEEEEEEKKKEYQVADCWIAWELLHTHFLDFTEKTLQLKGDAID
jgi:hypothetical protein